MAYGAQWARSNRVFVAERCAKKPIDQREGLDLTQLQTTGAAQGWGPKQRVESICYLRAAQVAAVLSQQSGRHRVTGVAVGGSGRQVFIGTSGPGWVYYRGAARDQGWGAGDVHVGAWARGAQDLTCAPQLLAVWGTARVKHMHHSK